MRSLKNDRRYGSTGNTLQWICMFISVGDVQGELCGTFWILTQTFKCGESHDVEELPC